MAKISVEIPLTWGRHLKEQLEALRSQRYQDFEISVASSMAAGSYEDILKDYGAKVTYCGPNILEKRYYAHKISRGECSLLLDETRIPHVDLLMKLQSMNDDMVVIEERDIGNSFWIRMSNLDKENAMNCNDFSATKGYIMPRYFRFGLLTEALERIRNNLNELIFKSVLMEDHQLIYYEASQISNSLALLNGNYLYHYGDEKLFSIVKKFHKYGKGHRTLKDTAYRDLLPIRNRIRSTCSAGNICLSIFLLARGLPFLIGYYVI